jgi:SnoaL-like protein
MVNLSTHGVSVALLLGNLLAGNTSVSAFPDRASPLGAGTSEAAAVADKVLAIAANQAVRKKDVKGAVDAERRQAMPNSVSTLLTRNLYDVFGENDPKRRRAAIDEMFTEDCVFYEPSGGVYRGRDEMDRVAGALRATHPDFRYQPIAKPEEVGNGGRIQWVEGRPGEAPAVAGTDFIIAPDGRIAAIYLFFDKLPGEPSNGMF